MWIQEQSGGPENPNQTALPSPFCFNLCSQTSRVFFVFSDWVSGFSFGCLWDSPIPWLHPGQIHMGFRSNHGYPQRSWSENYHHNTEIVSECLSLNSTSQRNLPHLQGLLKGRLWTLWLWPQPVRLEVTSNTMKKAIHKPASNLSYKAWHKKMSQASHVPPWRI